jgi:DNA-binding CsgD family transcriptional regulator
MLDLDDYDQVVAHIYEAALVPAHWDIALTAMMDRFAPIDWHVCFVVWERLDPPAGRFIGSTGVHPLAQAGYLEHFAGRHEWSIRGHELKLGQVVPTDMLIDRDAFKETAFYQKFLGPWGYEQALLGMLDRQRTDHLAIACPGPPGVDVSILQKAITLLTPHIQRAARISRRIGEADMRAATAADMLDSSPYSAIALGPDMELLLANKMGEQLIERSGAFKVLRGRLNANDLKLQKQLSEMASGKSQDRAITFTAKGKNGSDLVMTALIVSQQHGDRFAQKAGGTALMLVGGQRIEITDASIQALQQGFGFTAAEARLASFLVLGSGVKGYADDKGVSVEAGKYLLKGIYAKTGLSNQTELVAMLRETPLGWGTPLQLTIPEQN